MSVVTNPSRIPHSAFFERVRGAVCTAKHGFFARVLVSGARAFGDVAIRRTGFLLHVPRPRPRPRSFVFRHAPYCPCCFRLDSTHPVFIHSFFFRYRFSSPIAIIRVLFFVVFFLSRSVCSVSFDGGRQVGALFLFLFLFLIFVWEAHAMPVFPERERERDPSHCPFPLPFTLDLDDNRSRVLDTDTHSVEPLTRSSIAVSVAASPRPKSDPSIHLRNSVLFSY